VYKVLDEWKRNKTFGSDVLGGIKMEEFNVPGVAPSSSFSGSSSSTKVLSSVKLWFFLFLTIFLLLFSPNLFLFVQCLNNCPSHGQ
jgi:hypothetical protein